MARWFGPKLIGYGIGPRSWQGWLATLVMAILAVGAALVIRHEGLPAWAGIVALAVILGGYLILVSQTYGEDD